MGGASPSPEIVVVDDEPDLREMVGEYLAKNGFSVRLAGNGGELDAALRGRPADLILLDLNMPGEDGLAIARRVRATSAIPIVMLTAAASVVDRVVGLEVGADDYIAKPFDLRELLARLRAVLRRFDRATAPAAKEDRRLVRMGRARLDLEGGRLLFDDNSEQTLTAMEFDLLRAFAESPNKVLSRERLLEVAHKRDWEPFDRSIDVRIARIRRKVERDPQKPEVIKTVHGLGYIFASAP